MATRSKTTQKGSRAQSGNKKKRGCLFWLGVTSVLLIVVVLVLLSLLFSGAPEVPRATPKPQDFALQAKLMQRLYKESSQRQLKESTLTLTPAEIASLVRIADAAYELGGSAFVGDQLLAPRNYELKLKDDSFDLVVPYNTGKRWLFGGYIRIGLTVSVEKDGDRFKVFVSRCRAGRYPIPAALVTEAANQAIEKEMANPDSGMQGFNQAVRSLYINDNGDLVIVYSPPELFKLLLKR